MQRLVFGLFLILLVVGLLALLYLKFTLPQEDSTVHLSDNSNIQGYVTKKDNYIIVYKDSSEQLIPWTEVKSVSGPKPLNPKLSLFGYWVDKIDFLSGLGVIAALVVFSVGLYQYQQGLIWKREEFLTGVIKAFGESPSVRNARRMMESLIQYEGDSIELYPENPEGETSVYITNKEVIEALEVPLKEVCPHAPRIRYSFDVFLDYLQRFDHYIQSRVVTRKSLYVYMGYWVDILGRHDSLRGRQDCLSSRHVCWEDYRIQIIKYAKYFGYTEVIKLLNRYNRGHRFWCWIRSPFRKSNINPKEKNPSGLLTCDDVNMSPLIKSEDAEAEINLRGLAAKVISSIVISLFTLHTLRNVWKKQRKRRE